MAQNIEKRGIGLNETRHMKQLITLRNGELKFFDSDALKLVDTMFLQQKFSCSINNKRLDLSTFFPIPSKYTYKFSTEKELLSWHDAIKQSIKIEERKQRKRIELIKAGFWANISFNNENDDKKIIWIENNDLICSKQKVQNVGVSSHKMIESIKINQINEIFYGISLKTTLILSPHSSILETKPFIQLRTNNQIIRINPIRESDTKDFLLALQWLLISVNPGIKIQLLSEGQFYYKKLQLKLLLKARSAGLVYSAYLREIIQKAISNRTEFPHNLKATNKMFFSRPQTPTVVYTTRTENNDKLFSCNSVTHLGTTNTKNRITSNFRQPLEKRTISLNLIEDNMLCDCEIKSEELHPEDYVSNKENSDKNIPRSNEIMDVSFNNSSCEPSENCIIVPKIPASQKTMGEQSFSLDTSEISKVYPEKVFGKIGPQELENQNTSRFKNSPVEICEEESSSCSTKITPIAEEIPVQSIASSQDLEIIQLKRKIQELQEENLDNQRQAQYWKTKLSLVTQDLNDKLLEKSQEVNLFKESAAEFEKTIAQLQTQNQKLSQELSYFYYNFIYRKKDFKTKCVTKSSGFRRK